MTQQHEQMEHFAEWVTASLSRPRWLLAYAFVLVLSLLAGAAGYLYRLQFGKSHHRFSWRDFALDLFGSGLTGIIVFWLTLQQALPAAVAAVIIAIAAHMGVRAIGLATKMFHRQVRGWLGKEPSHDME